jgi:hypothetical protein
MTPFLAAHGYEPGPSQRPVLAGVISGMLGTAPAIAVLIAFGSLRVEEQILGISQLGALCAGWLAMAIAGAAYTRFFGRAANGRKGGWLFGMSFGFALWAAGAVLVLPLLSGGRAPAGTAAIGVALSMLVWGASTGILVPFVQRPLHESIETASKRADVGPSAMAAHDGPIRRRHQNGSNQNR